MQVQPILANLKGGRWSVFSAEDVKEIRAQFHARWVMLHRPIHAAAYMLHPVFWDDTEAMKVPELFEGTKDTIKRLLGGHDAIAAAQAEKAPPPPQPTVMKAMFQLSEFR